MILIVKFMAPMADRSDALQLCILLCSCAYHINHSVNLITLLHLHTLCACVRACVRAYVRVHVS